MENDTINIREYFPSDKEAVLELMRLNTPLYFASEEEADLSEYLDNEREYYYVLLSGGEIIGCGGINIADNGTRGKISWDIIHPDWQGHSLGSLLLKCIFKNIKQIQWNGRPVRTPSDFMLVADRIEEKTGEHISDSTIKRLWIPKLGYRTVSERTLNVLASYVGYGHFKAYCEALRSEGKLSESEIVDGETSVRTATTGKCLTATVWEWTTD